MSDNWLNSAQNQNMTMMLKKVFHDGVNYYDVFDEIFSYNFSIYNDNGVFGEILMYGMQKTLTMTMTCLMTYCCYMFI